MTIARLAVVAIVAVTAGGARATVFTSITTEELTRRAVAVVTGEVERITAVQAEDGDLYTLVRVRVEETLKGHVSTPTITLKEDGGVVGSRIKVVYGSPHFRLKERVLLFLTKGPNGAFRTTEMALGKFGLTRDAQRRTIARREFGAGAAEIVVPGVRRLRHTIPLATLRADVTDAARFQPEATDDPLPFHESFDAVWIRELAETLPDGSPPTGRFHEADEGIPIAFVIDELQDSFLAPGAARRAWFAAMAAWTNVPTASVVLAHGDDGDPTLHRTLGFQARSGCGGVAGYGGWIGDAAEAKVFGGHSYARILNAFATIFADDPAGCPLYNQCNVAEVATHEIGHAIGLRHSADNMSTMAGAAHHDCRCASLAGDDAEVLSALYPLARPPTITTPSVLPDATVGVFYQQSLTAVGGTGAFTWAFVGLDGFEDVGVDDFGPGLTVEPDGILSGVPQKTDLNGSALIRATDTAGDSHTRRFTLRINPASSSTSTTVSTTTTSTAVVPDPAEPIPCETTTTSTLPSWCDLQSGFTGVSCKVEEGQQLIKAFPRHRGQAMRLFRRIENRTVRANNETVRIKGNLAKAARLIKRAERTALRLVALSERPRFVGAVGGENAGALTALGEVLVGRLRGMSSSIAGPSPDLTGARTGVVRSLGTGYFR